VSVSAAIIVQDDADRLDACLTSLRGLVDEIVVVDTGSTDRSVAVAEEHGAVVAREPWRGDSASSRNRGLELATGDWILTIDVGERVRGDVVAARAFLDAADDRVGLELRCVPRAGWTPSLEYRVWRNRPDLRFEGVIDETIVPSIHAVADAEHLRVERLDGLTIQHDGTGRDSAGARVRDAPLLLAELARNPDRPLLYDHLARLYAAAGDRERALETWREGLARVRARDDVRPDDSRLSVGLIHHLLVNDVVDDEFQEVVEEARGRYDRIPIVELAAARLAFATGRPRDALAPLDWLLALDEEGIIATGASCDERVFGEWAWALLGLCRFALGDDAAAADAFAHAEQLAPGDPSYGVRRRLAEARAATPSS
jgi:tetratricopeptide (TPR) repeat protein